MILDKGHGRCDYLLYVDRCVVGVIEAKPVGTTLSGVQWQTAMYAVGLPEAYRDAAVFVEDRLPFIYEASGVETISRTVTTHTHAPGRSSTSKSPPLWLDSSGRLSTTQSPRRGGRKFCTCLHTRTTTLTVPCVEGCRRRHRAITRGWQVLSLPRADGDGIGQDEDGCHRVLSTPEVRRLQPGLPVSRGSQQLGRPDDARVPRTSPPRTTVRKFTEL